MKKKILCWSDSATAFTGFGTVSKHVMTALHNTGKYDLYHLAVNYHGQFVDKDKFPWQIVPAKLSNPRDPYGNQMFLRSIAEQDYDYVWILNDTFVVHPVAQEMRRIFSEKKAAGKKVPKVVYYYPVDCRVIPEGSDMLRAADQLVCYTEHGRQETLEALPEVKDKLVKIHHGTDTRAFRPLTPEERLHARKRYFGIEDDTFLVINVNRNSVRKQLTKTMACFKLFKQRVPKALLYLHTMPIDRNIDLYAAAKHLQLKPKEDLVFPPKYSPQTGYPDKVLNELYNAADLFLTTHLGEGWGLTVTEAMAAGVPVLAPDNTSMPEILGSGERGYLYDCPEVIYVDPSGFRPMGLTMDIVDQMLAIKEKGRDPNDLKIRSARKWVEQNNWDIVCRDWIDLFDQLEVRATKEPEQLKIVGEIL